MKLRPVISYWKMGSAESGGRRRERTWDGEIKKERKGPIRNDLITVRAGGKTLPSALHITV